MTARGTRGGGPPDVVGSGTAHAPVTRLAPLVEPGPRLGPEELARYARHLALPGIGVDGQRRLAAARVLVVGAGGLGSPALLYLAASGVGTLGIVDDDVVEASNLQRQVIHGHPDLGAAKTASAAATVRAINPAARVVEHRDRLTARNVLEVMAGYDLVLDGTDAFAVRYLLSDAAEVAGLPCVWGALHRFTGQVSTFWAAPRGVPPGPEPVGVTYRDVFPVPPPPGASPDCATAGVFGAVCGAIGTAMATEAIKLITGVGRPLLGRLLLHDALEATWRTLTVRPDPDREPVTELLSGSDGDGGADPYAVFCGVAAPGAADGTQDVEMPAVDEATTVPEATAADLLAARERGAELVVLDVREGWEAEIAPFPGARVVPSGRFAGAEASAVVGEVRAWADGRTVHVLCASGVRSRRVAGTLRTAGVTARSVPGGTRSLTG